MANTEVIPYTPPPAVEYVTPPTFTDAKAQRQWVKWQRDKRLIESAMPALLMIGSVWGLKQMEYNNLMSKPAANLTATACVLSILMKEVPGEAWTAMGNVGVEAVKGATEIMPKGLWDFFF